MSKPPHTPPHSDIDGVHEDAESNIETANEAGEDGEDLKRAHDQSRARPEYSDEKEGSGGR